MIEDKLIEISKKKSFNRFDMAIIKQFIKELPEDFKSGRICQKLDDTATSKT